MSSTIRNNQIPYIKVFSDDSSKYICEDGSCDVSNDSVAKKIKQTFLDVSSFFASEFPELKSKMVGEENDLYIHWKKKNAAYNPNLSQGSKRCFEFNDRFTQPQVVAHEYTHSIVASYVKLAHREQSGALGESVADVLAIAYKHWSFKNSYQRNCNDWKIVDDRDLSHPAKGIKTLEPGSKPNEDNDFGYIHENSLIPSHAFYLAVKKAKVETWGAIAKIWLSAVKEMKPNDNFATFSARTIEIAENPFKEIIRKAWKEVGVVSQQQKSVLNAQTILVQGALTAKSASKVTSKKPIRISSAVVHILQIPK